MFNPRKINAKQKLCTWIYGSSISYEISLLKLLFVGVQKYITKKTRVIINSLNSDVISFSIVEPNENNLHSYVQN